MKKMYHSCIVAFSMYSKLPMPACDWNKETMAYAMAFFPWVGAVIGVVSYLAFILKEYALRLDMGFTPLFFTVLLVLIPLFITGGIHMDGFLDTQDAMSSYQTKERRLEILKDSHAGAFAILSAIVYMLSYVAIMSMVNENSMRMIALGYFLSRSLSGISVLTFTQAREKGLAATFAENAAKRRTLTVLYVSALICIICMCLFGHWVGVCTVAAAAIVFILYRRMAYRNFGGVTGDLAGYFLQMCEIGMSFAAVLSSLIIGGICS